MENDEFLYTPHSYPAEDSLKFRGFKELSSLITDQDKDLFIIINKTRKQFFIVGDSVLKHSQRLTTINLITLKDLQKWQTK
ncbi:hypothetical protein [Myroides odoratus]|uniref:Uncharacterized protein n=1 Tax=Myroides odoratus TaxID=256 RepID=A0A9Q7EA92_MYROD|nr:hypothetical protein [Myroides odoratus]EHQ41498.1 hypothetical protein Myrod_0662 [Myroides odoratus DSM 2801]EKB02709.1 hypothetical protein HMPREF9716_03738 [Myroides odoratus CIP 103059]QQT98924.1 hypothetical protein I6I88_11935 [Myroides odoratus]WQD58891.1 hypothetical protein U0010_07040 [Myroides odoratus]STZ28761.1 Uncharacterised protein [Myroides odoratus]